MANYLEMIKDDLLKELDALAVEYADKACMLYDLDMSRGKPSAQQLDLSMGMLKIEPDELVKNRDGIDVRNYGYLSGIAEVKELFADILGVDPKNIFVGGQSSLALMYDCFANAMLLGVGGCQPWVKQEKIKFLCPVPGYDRHFAICKQFGVEMINIPMTPDGPDMNEVRRYAETDPSVKGIWCVPKYSNPQGYTYSPQTVMAFASLKPAAPDFRIFWDNAYIVHGFTEDDDKLANIFDLCKIYGSQDMVYEFTSTSKITFPGAGVAVVAASDNNIKELTQRFSVQAVCFDKLNQLRHAKFFGNAQGMKEHMKKHGAIMAPKFEKTLSVLNEQLAPYGIGSWTKPKGGYFISYDGLPKTAKRCLQLCNDLGVKFTDAGATFPHGNDPEDKNIRIAPSLPTLDELQDSLEVFCLCQRIAAIETIVNDTPNC